MLGVKIALISTGITRLGTCLSYSLVSNIDWSIEWHFSQGRIFYTIILSMIKLCIMSEYTVAQIGCLDGSFRQ